jgi:hypothetical protein
MTAPVDVEVIGRDVPMCRVALAGLDALSLAKLIGVESLHFGLVLLLVELEGVFDTHGRSRRRGACSPTHAVLELHADDTPQGRGEVMGGGWRVSCSPCPLLEFAWLQTCSEGR